MGGATYARAMAKGVAFGAVFPGGPDMAHQADEHIMVDDLMKNALVYAHAICEMCASK
jgi:succinyl-diaminopimelate desuccinylase